MQTDYRNREKRRRAAWIAFLILPPLAIMLTFVVAGTAWRRASSSA